MRGPQSTSVWKDAVWGHPREKPGRRPKVRATSQMLRHPSCDVRRPTMSEGQKNIITIIIIIIIIIFIFFIIIINQSCRHLDSGVLPIPHQSGLA